MIQRSRASVPTNSFANSETFAIEDAACGLCSLVSLLVTVGGPRGTDRKRRLPPFAEQRANPSR